MSSFASSAKSSAKLFDVQVVAELLGCSPRHVHRLSDAGRMPRPVKIGSLCRWSKSSIESWVRAGCPRCDQRKGGSDE